MSASDRPFARLLGEIPDLCSGKGMELLPLPERLSLLKAPSCKPFSQSDCHYFSVTSPLLSSSFHFYF